MSRPIIFSLIAAAFVLQAGAAKNKAAKPTIYGQTYEWHESLATYRYAPETWDEPTNVATNSYRSDDQFAPDSGRNPYSLEHLIRNLSDWPAGEKLSSQERRINMVELQRGMFQDKFTKLKKRRQDLEMTLNEVTGPDFQFPIANQDFTAIYGNDVDYAKKKLLNFEVRFTLPRELLVLHVTQGFRQLINRFALELASSDRATELELWATLAQREGPALPSLKTPDVDEAKVSRILDELEEQAR